MIYLEGEHGLLLSSGSSYISADFYNAFFHDLFSLSASEAALTFSYSSAGRLALEVWHELPSGASQRVHASILDPSAPGSTHDAFIRMPVELQTVRKGFLYFRFTAVDSHCTITRVRWCSLRSSVRTPCLGLVITHFRRETEVQAFVSSIRGTELETMLACGKMKLTIVDNSQTLPVAPDDLAGASILPNANYGGSGGFARGMLESMRLGCSHCLLLDDDASLGEEGILRMWARHAMASTDTAISAILLQAEDPFRVVEAAANYNGRCMPIAVNQNILEFDKLKWLWSSPPRADYGAWCGFSFPVSSVCWYPFPFFVRGDDILFSMINHVSIVTMNGVCAHVPSFERKEGPLQVLLHTRAELVVNATVSRKARIKTAHYYAKAFLKDLVSYRYGHCMARHHGLWMYADTENAFTGDMDGVIVRGKARDLNRFWPLAGASMDGVDPRGVRTKKYSKSFADVVKKVFFALTLNGHLIPSASLFQRHVYKSDLLYRISFKDSFLASGIIYNDHMGFADGDDQSRYCRFDQRVGLCCLLILIVDVACILLFSPAWSRRAEQTVRRLSTAEFWRQTYRLPSAG